MLQRTLPVGFIAPCLPTKTDKLPSGGQWLHEIKHDGFASGADVVGVKTSAPQRPKDQHRQNVTDGIEILTLDMRLKISTAIVSLMR